MCVMWIVYTCTMSLERIIQVDSLKTHVLCSLISPIFMIGMMCLIKLNKECSLFDCYTPAFNRDSSMNEP